MTTKLDILNSVRYTLADTPIASEEEAQEQAQILDGIKRAVLQSKSWRFALKRATLSRLTEEPKFGYKYQYQLPHDFARLMKIDGEEYKFEVNGDLILTDAEVVKIEYLSDTVKYEDLPANIIKCIQFRLMAELALFYERLDVVPMAMNQAELYLSKASRQDAMNERVNNQMFKYTWADYMNNGGR